MAMTSYLKVEGMRQGPIEGDCTQKGQEKWILVYGLDHSVELPRDPLSGLPTGQRMHKPFVITKAVDQASPLLYAACASGEHMKKWELVYKRINEKGQEEKYFTIALQNAVIVRIRHYKPLTLLETNKPYHDMEEISFSYTRITWTHNIASKEAVDDWNEPVNA